jgi:endonuclease-3 related protein
MKTEREKEMAHPIVTSSGRQLMEMYGFLLDHFGQQNWWPAETELEVMVGAILTQNTNWNNVKKAIDNLKKKGLLTLEGLISVGVEELAGEIRPAGYYNIKAVRLKNLIHYLQERFPEDFQLAVGVGTGTLREELLAIKGIGPETADSILLYAFGRPVFVIDAYTYRILHRHGIYEDQASYEELQEFFQSHLPDDPSFFNEFHALIVMAGKNYCKKNPLCDLCPLEKWGPTSPSR